MIANEFLLITNENGLPKEAARIGLNWSRSERVLRILPASGQTEQAHPREAEAQHCPGRGLGNRSAEIATDIRCERGERPRSPAPDGSGKRGDVGEAEANATVIGEVDSRYDARGERDGLAWLSTGSAEHQ